MGEIVEISQAQRVKSQFRHTRGRRVWADVDFESYEKLRALQLEGETMSQLVRVVLTAFVNDRARAEGIS